MRQTDKVVAGFWRNQLSQQVFNRRFLPFKGTSFWTVHSFFGWIDRFDFNNIAH